MMAGISRAELASNLSAEAWNAAIASLPGAHVLQSAQWGRFKHEYGWQPLPYLWRAESGQVRAAALVLRRAVRLGLNVCYIPRGPVLDWSDEALRLRVLDDVQSLAAGRGTILLKMDPEVALGWGVPGATDSQDEPIGQQAQAGFAKRGWRFSPDQIQFRNTVLIDLHGSEDSWLARMKQKTRYNIRLAERKGVRVRPGTLEDLPLLYRMYAETSLRDGFVIRPESYYHTLWQSFMADGLAHPLIAEVHLDGAAPEAVAGLILFTFAQRAWYLHGMSRAVHRDRMPTYLLQWEAMRRAKAAGATCYDLWGAPDVFAESDSMWGVYRFKEGLGGEVVRTLGAWDYTARPLLYQLYTRLLPQILNIMRRRRQARTRQEVAL